MPVAYVCRKIWGSGSVRSSHQTVSDYAIRQRFPNFQQPRRFLTACQAPRKISFTFHFLTQVFHPWWCETCRVTQRQFWMKECDIFRGSKHTLAPHTYSQGVPTPWSTPLLYAIVLIVELKPGPRSPIQDIRFHATRRTGLKRNIDVMMCYASANVTQMK